MKKVLADMEDKELYIECDCHSPEHHFILRQWMDAGYPLMVLDVHLVHWEGFFRRIWIGIKYIFGYRSRYGEFDEVVISKKDAHRVVEFMQEFIEQEPTWEKKRQQDSTIYVPGKR